MLKWKYKETWGQDLENIGNQITTRYMYHQFQRPSFLIFLDKYFISILKKIKEWDIYFRNM